MIKSVFILGNHIQALGIARQIRDLGIEAILFTDTKYSITRFSNAIKQSFIFNNEDDLLDKIINLNKNPRNILLFPTNDLMVDFLCQNYTLLSKLFYMGIPEPETVNIFADKCNSYRFAAKHNIPIPESYFPGSMKEVEEISKKVRYPVIIKPAIMHNFHKTFGKKAFKCDNREELIGMISNVAEKIPIVQLIIQEFLDGGAKALYSYGTFAVNGKAIVSLIANRTRQNPMNFGNSTTYAVTCNIPEVREQAEKILELTKYFGLAEVEFMYDKKTGQYKFLEINTRAWKWHSISDGLGFSFIGKMISYFNYNDTAEIKNYNQVTGWIERLTDTFVVIREILRGNNLLKETFRSYITPKVYAVWSPYDMLPLFMYLLLSPILYFNRH
jgi:D-aspartate ligase